MTGGRRRRAVLLGAGATALAVAVAAFVASRPAPGPELSQKVEGTAPPFTLENLRPGQPDVSLAELRGKPVVMNFWASWCVPCKREMPAFAAVSEQVKDRVAFVGINHQDGQRAALELLAETGVRYPSGYDPEGRVAAAYGLFGMPTTIFISPEGRLLHRRTGEMPRQELEGTIERLFGTGATS